MKILLINGSPKENGNTFLALNEVAKTLNDEGIETEIINIGKQAVQGCIACGMCGRIGKCTFNDDLYTKVLRTVKTGIDGLIIGSPVYYGGPNGSLCALLDRVFYSMSRMLQYKPGACIAVCRRGGASAAFDRLNKYFTINNMPVDHAHPRPQHGMDGQETERSRGRTSTTGETSMDKLHLMRFSFPFWGIIMYVRIEKNVLLLFI